jgi:hypothetical protein
LAEGLSYREIERTLVASLLRSKSFSRTLGDLGNKAPPTTRPHECSSDWRQDGGVAAQYTFENLKHFESAFRRYAIRAPQLPWTKIHDQFGIERRSIKIVGIARRNLPHRLPVLDCVLPTIDIGILRIARAQCIHIRFSWSGASFARAAAPSIRLDAFSSPSNRIWEPIRCKGVRNTG